MLMVRKLRWSKGKIYSKLALMLVWICRIFVGIRPWALLVLAVNVQWFNIRMTKTPEAALSWVA
jgi:hypothetical protein